MQQESQHIDVGVVLRTEGNLAVVELQENAACSTCGARFICLPGSEKKRVIKALNSINAGVGNRVRIHEKEKMELIIALLQYGIPLIGFLSGIILYKLLPIRNIPFPEELMMFLSGLLFLLSGGLISKQGFKKLAKSGEHFFYISAFNHPEEHSETQRPASNYQF